MAQPVPRPLVGAPDGHATAFACESDVLEEERAHLQHRRAQLLGEGDGPEFAVSFSGGGVRSAAFCSGVLWALAEARLLRRVSHLSAVSGGSIAAASFASHLVRHGREPGAEGVDGWYAAVVAELIARCQRNAGYLVSFEGDLWRKPEDNSASLPRVLDGGIMVLVIVGMLVVAPAMFVVFYIIPISVLIEAYWGDDLRRCFCTRVDAGDREDGGCLLNLLRSSPTCIALLCALVGLLVLLMVLKPFVGRSEQPPFGRYMAWRSLVMLCTRWLVFVLLMLSAVSLVNIAQTFDYKDVRCNHDPWQGPGGPSEGRWPGPIPHVQGGERGLHPVGSALGEWSRAAQAQGGALSFFWNMLVGTCLFLVVALSFKVVGWTSFLWQLFLALFLPLYFMIPACFVLQWRVFGPVTGQPLAAPVLGMHIWDGYSSYAWQVFATLSLSLAILGLPAFNMLHRFVHHYFRRSLLRAFYRYGEDVTLAEVVDCPRMPLLLFGATLNDFQRPDRRDTEPHTVFALTQHAMGCERTGFLRAPRWLTLSKYMTWSCAAADGLVLTQLSHWHTRLVFALLNLLLGDWLRFDAGQHCWHDRLCPGIRHVPSAAGQRLVTMLDRLPEMLLWTAVYGLLMLMNASVDDRGPGSLFQVCRAAVLSLLMLFVGVLSFFPQLDALSWLHASPLVRQIHMFVLSQTVSPQPPMYLYLSDGGPLEDLGVVQLLRRRQRWILSIDAGDDPACDLLDLHASIALARAEGLCSFYHVADPRRDLEEVLREYAAGREPFLRLGVLYADAARAAAPAGAEEVGEIFHVRMRLLESGDQPVSVMPEISREEVLGSFAGADPEHGGTERPSPPCEPSQLIPMSAEAELEMVPPGCSPDQTADPGEFAWLPRSELAGLCCRRCHGHACSSLACGTFPNTHTVNQFFTPVVWANFCRLGRELSSSAIAAMCRAQEEAANS